MCFGHIGGYIFAELNVLDAQLFVQIIVQNVSVKQQVYRTGKTLSDIRAEYMKKQAKNAVVDDE